FQSSLNALKKSYLQKIPEKIQKLRDFVQNLKISDDPKDTNSAMQNSEFLRFLHSFKGSSGTYGFSNLHILCQKLEQIIKKELQNQNYLRKEVVDYIQLWIEIIEGCIEKESLTFEVKKKDWDRLNQMEEYLKNL
ncbi:MAG: hypothetical protein D6785_07640, partial [Planctomycetota bacterium]